MDTQIDETKLGSDGEEFLERQVGKILKQVREDRGLTQEEVARALGDYQQSQISHVENQRKTVSFVEAVRFCEVYDITLAEIRDKLKKQVALQQAILDKQVKA